MTDKIAVDRDFLEHAVIALEYAYNAEDEMVQESIKYLRAALAQKAEPVANAPVAWIDEFGNVFPLGAWVRSEVREKWKPLYTEPAANAAPPAPAAVPPGYAVVPIEPTPGMIDAGFGKLLYVASPQPRHIYRAMIAAAAGEKP